MKTSSHVKSGVSVLVYEQPPEINPTKTKFTLTKDDFTTESYDSFGRVIHKKSTHEPYLIIGFDTEFKTPEYHFNRQDIEAGYAKYRVLSYQFHAKTECGQEWKGICCTEGDERMTMEEFLTFALGKGVKDHGIEKLPHTIYLVGHFTRADIPAFADFQSLTSLLSSVRSTFANIDHSIEIFVGDETSGYARVRVVIRDTMLLTPQGSKSLRGIGELVGFPKLQLDPDIKIHNQLIEHMDVVRRDNWQVYKDYALMDATICVRYIERIIEQYELTTGKRKVPVTLTSIGVDLLLKSWHEDLQLDYLDVLGKEIVKERIFDKRRNYYVVKKVEVNVEELNNRLAMLTECYHGGRNEQYWFGPGFEDDWIDLDLSSAYPTAMSLIGMPDWKAMRETKELSDFTPTTLGFAWINFKFPESIRYPSIPVRTNNGLVFPQEGTAYCAAPEIFGALQLGCEIEIRLGIIVPTNPKVRVFGEFIRKCLDKRMQAGSKTLEGLFWKEISNSTYGKTAQGLNKKRVYDMRERSVKQLPPSRITNPCFAAYITSYVRALLGEIMNSIPNDKMVFSCTTDGFLTNVSQEEIPRLESGPLAKIYALARQDLAGDMKILEIKHSIRRPLGWRTRGQATLKAHDHLVEDDKGIVLAKGGIFTRPESETNLQRNREVVDLFFSRTPESVIRVESLTGIRDIVEFDADLVGKDINKRLSMEYDWKRQPFDISVCDEYGHIHFNTRPWKSITQFVKVRDLWDEYTKGSPQCLKSLDDFERFADSVECKGLDDQSSKYLRKKDPDLHRLRQSLCEAWHFSEAGIQKTKDMSAQAFAELLDSIGIPCKRSDVENARRGKSAFVPNMVPSTQRVRESLIKLRARFPKLMESRILANPKNSGAVTIRTNVGK